MPKLTKSNRRTALKLSTAIGVALAVQLPSAASAQSQGAADDLALLRQAVEQLQAQQRDSAARIAELEAALKQARTAAIPAETTMPSGGQAGELAPAGQPPALASAAATNTSASGSTAKPSRLQLGGDVRVRYESNFGDQDARNRDRGVLRARLRAAFAINDWLTVGGQIATGDPDDPNSADISLSNWDDDLQVSLDQAYIRTTFGGLQLHLGKIPQPFVRTELVWDGDVSPQGVSASYTFPVGDSGARLKANALYFLVDESVAGPNSDMIGGQLAFETAAGAPWRFELAAGYYDYSLRSLGGGDSGDFRSNLIANGRYVSDFNMLDVIGAITWNGLGEAWPVRFVADYVKNFGARVDGDTGYGADLLVGRISKPHDWRFGYGYAQTGVDAVLAAFSQDNTNIGTNYLQHSLSIDYVPVDHVVLNATLYHYRPKNPLYAGINDPDDWLNRVRFNFLVNF